MVDREDMDKSLHQTYDKYSKYDTTNKVAELGYPKLFANLIDCVSYTIVPNILMCLAVE